MPLSWNEIKSRALAFVNEYQHEASEDAEAKSFWDDFFRVFDVQRRRLASFEYHVKKLNNKDGFVDLFWPGTLIVEHKSRGRSLDKAHGQVLEYFHGIPDKELPKYILVSDFAAFRLYDLDNGTQHDFPLTDFVNQVQLFGFIAGYQKRTYKEQDPVNIKAAEVMGRLHDKLKAIGYTGHQLEVYLVRLLFCLFADDTGIFEEKGIFNDYLELKTAEDGNDLAARLAELFQVLNTAKQSRFRNVDETLNAFPYVNGKLFDEHLPLASFDSEMRRILLDCCILDWGKISPAIFGSLFQSVMDEKGRRNLGAHYTSEKNILKLIKPLFLDDLWKEFEAVKSEKAKLKKLHEKISRLRILDPACGCGNFLIIAYRELRLLELEIIKVQLKGQQVTSINDYFLLDVDRFYGIEYEEFPAQIAQVAMWLIDHQMNMQASTAFGEYYVRLPLKKSATIKHGNALRTDWQSLIEPMPWEKEEARFDYILGNPPFIGSKLMNDEQRKDVISLFQNSNGAGVLDYVTAWYLKAAQYMKQYTATKAAFVSTNSISQGEQVGILWSELIDSYKIQINFAHQTFKWSNEARGVAAVYCVIIGLANNNSAEKRLFQYIDIKGEPLEVKVANINPYLVEGKNIFIRNRKKPLCNVPVITKGNQPTDGGHLLLDEEEYRELILNHPEIIPFTKKLIGAQEFIQNIPRYCLWFADVNPTILRSFDFLKKRLDDVKQMRLASTDPNTRRIASTPYLFRETRVFKSYIIIPSVSSERRNYIPIGFLDSDTIPTNLVLVIPDATHYHFGILTSFMHMAWVKYTCGRLESRYRYSKDIVYNNFPWPEAPTEKQTASVEAAAQAVLDARAGFPQSSLADLYDPNTMPPVLVKTHAALDKAVDLCYRPQPFATETKRIEYLFELYDKYTSGLFAVKKNKKTKQSKQ